MPVRNPPQCVWHHGHQCQDAGTLNEVPGVTGPSGGFGQQADSVTIDNLRQNTWLTTAGSFTLPGFNLTFGNARPRRPAPRPPAVPR